MKWYIYFTRLRVPPVSSLYDDGTGCRDGVDRLVEVEYLRDDGPEEGGMAPE